MKQFVIFNMQILLFGQLVDVAGETVELDPVNDTDGLVKALHRQHPALANMKYVIAVDKKVITANQALHEKSEIALLPPFSGG